MIAKALVEEALTCALSTGADFAELYGENTRNNSISMVDGKIDRVGDNLLSGVGIRAFLGTRTVFASTSDISREGLLRCAASVASVIGIACAVNFKKTFEIFHKIFFPGKTNWKFKPAKDPIIELLPNQFFANCALLIFGAILAFCIGIMIYEFIPKKVDSSKSAVPSR